MKAGYVYILTNKPDGVLYIGVTSDLAQRLFQHRAGEVAGFTKKYNCQNLVWFERFDDLQDARQFEVRMKNGTATGRLPGLSKEIRTGGT